MGKFSFQLSNTEVWHIKKYLKSEAIPTPFFIKENKNKIKYMIIQKASDYSKKIIGDIWKSLLPGSKLRQ